MAIKPRKFRWVGHAMVYEIKLQNFSRQTFREEIYFKEIDVDFSIILKRILMKWCVRFVLDSSGPKSGLVVYTCK